MLASCSILSQSSIRSSASAIILQRHVDVPSKFRMYIIRQETFDKKKTQFGNKNYFGQPQMLIIALNATQALYILFNEFPSTPTSVVTILPK